MIKFLLKKKQINLIEESVEYESGLDNVCYIYTFYMSTCRCKYIDINVYVYTDSYEIKIIDIYFISSKLLEKHISDE